MSSDKKQDNSAQDQFRAIIDKDRETRQRNHWKGTVIQYLDLVKSNPELTQLSHERLFKMLIEQGVEGIVSRAFLPAFKGHFSREEECDLLEIQTGSGAFLSPDFFRNGNPGFAQAFFQGSQGPVGDADVAGKPRRCGRVVA